MKYRVNGVGVTVTEDETIVEGAVKVYYAEFEFDSSWDSYTKIAVFKRGEESREMTLAADRCEIPWEVLQAGLGDLLSVGIRGVQADKTRPTLWAVPKVVHPGATSGDESKEPTPDVIQQIINLQKVDISDIDGGHRVTFYDSKGAKSFEVMDGTDYTLTEADKETIAGLSTTGGYVTIPMDGWADDTDIDRESKQVRVSYRGTGNSNPLILNPVHITEEWQTFSGSFVYENDGNALILRFYGGPSPLFIQPYDIADVKVYLASDKAKTNVLSSDIADLGWTMDTTMAGNRLAVSFEDGLKYIHVWRQTNNNVRAAAFTGVQLTQGETYILECRMRMICKQLHCTVPLDGVRASSATLITPTPSSIAECISHGVRGFAQRIGELFFTADTKPDRNITLAVSASRGRGGIMMNTKSALPLASILNLSADSWVDDSDTFANIKKMRIGYRDEYNGAVVYIKGAGDEIIPTYEWVTYSLPFTIGADVSDFLPFFKGGTSTNHVHPYDFMDVKVYAASDESQTNLMVDDLEAQRWISRSTETKNAIEVSDGLKYMHVFRQHLNHVEVTARTPAALAAGDYVLEFKLRLTPWKYTYVAPMREAHSEYVITVSPANDTVDVYGTHGIYCAAFGSQQLIFAAESVPDTDVKINCMVTQQNGVQGLIIQPPRMSVLTGIVDAALVDVIGEVT